MQTFEVAGRQLRHNGKQLKVGDKVRLSAADGAALASRGRVKPAAAAATPPSRRKGGSTKAPSTAAAKVPASE
jgi:hypothetical protein